MNPLQTARFSLRSTKLPPHAIRFAFGIAVLSVVGCDPGYELIGTVKSSAGEPIAGATAQAVCPKPPAPQATSDAVGKMHSQDIGFFADDCRIEVSAKGYTTETFTVSSTCRKRYLGSCLHVEINAVLKPAAP